MTQYNMTNQTPRNYHINRGANTNCKKPCP